jgi:hypothetical protein
MSDEIALIALRSTSPSGNARPAKRRLTWPKRYKFESATSGGQGNRELSSLRSGPEIVLLCVRYDVVGYRDG